MPLLTKEQREELINDYAAGLSTSALSKKYPIGQQGAHRFLQRRKLTRPQWVRQCSVNETAFDESIPDALYWAGFLMADGCISATERFKGKSARAEIHLVQAAVDIGHVEKFRKFLGSTHKITQRKNNAVAFTLNSRRIVNRLVELGIVPRKTWTGEARGAAISSPDFWRGVVDGDGTIRTWKRKDGHWTCTLSLCGASKSLLEQFRQFVQLIVPDYSGTVFAHGPIYDIVLGGRNAIPVIRSLWGRGGESLDRKAKTVQAILTMADADPLWCRRTR